MTIRGLLGLALAAGALVAPATVATPSAVAATTTPVPHTVPAEPAVGERTLVVVRFARSPERAGVLEERRGQRWVTTARGTSDAAGVFRLASRPTARAIFRVRVTAGREKGRVSKNVGVLPVPEQLSLMPSGTGTTGQVTGSATPVRARRPVVLERQRGKVWVEVGSGEEDGAGAVAVGLDHLPQAARTYRWRLPAWKGLPESVSDATAFAPTTYVPTSYGLPLLTIDTEGAAPVVSKEDYLRATMTLDGSTYPLQVRGRGNSTWKKPKKPLRLKLDTKAPLLGMPTEKDWALLANFGDRSLLRNTVGLDLGAALTAMPWTPRHRAVEVVLNGAYVGAYDLVEQVEVSDKRSAKNRLVLEVDEVYAATAPDTIRSPVEGLAVTFKDPNPEDVPQTTKDALVSDLRTFETALYADDFTADGHPYTDYVDVDSFVDYYLGSEIMKSIDGDCRTSCFFTWAPGQPFRMGPMWDYDHSAGFGASGRPIASPEGLYAGDTQPDPTYAHHATQWLARMLQDPAFRTRTRARWDELMTSGVLTGLPAAVDAGAAALGPMARNNDWERWSGAYHSAGEAHGDSPDAEVAYLRDWLTQRVAWLDAHLLVP